MASVLIVDDDHDVSEVAAEVLRDAGYAVTTTADMGVGVRVATELAPDVILLDLEMPDGGGEAFMRAYREGASGQTAVQTRAPKIVAFTALLDGPERAAAMGVQHVLAKPFHVPQLVRDMARWTAER